MPDLLGDGQNFKRKDKDDKVEGGWVIVLVCLSKCTAS